MRLDTSQRQSEAILLYERAGFRRIPPYYDLAEDVKDWLVFFELNVTVAIEWGRAASGCARHSA